MSEQMRLSEAIRLGGMATEQGRGGDSIVSASAPCALGAALLAIGQQDRNVITCYVNIRTAFPISNRYVADPVDGYRCPLVEAIYFLNDSARWTREQIADWVETIERRADAESARDAEHVVATAVSASAKV